MENAFEAFMSGLRERAASLGKAFSRFANAKAFPVLCGGAAALILLIVLLPSGGGSGSNADNPYAAYGISMPADGGGGLFQGLTLVSLILGFVIGAVLVGIVALWSYI